MFDYAGAIHIHTRYSFDGNVDIKDVIRSAKKCGLEFIIVTDHDVLDARRDGFEGWNDGLFVFVGQEIAPRNNHYLALGITRPVVATGAAMPAPEYMAAVAQQGGIGLIAHPDHEGAPKFGVKAYTWTDWSAKGFAGMSVWDLMTDWQRSLAAVPQAFIAWLFPTWVLKGPCAQTLRRWDEFNSRSMVAGYGEIDNHCSYKKIFGFTVTVFPFTYAFRTIRTHLLLAQPLSADTASACRQIMDAIVSGSTYIAQERWRSAKGFSFTIAGQHAGCVAVGKDVPVGLAVKLPSSARFRILRDGAEVFRGRGKEFSARITEHGAYRVEAEQRVWGLWKPWIYSNPIWLGVKHEGTT